MTDGVDRREDILVRLEALAKGVEDIEWAGRNAILDDTSNVRRITVLEGEEIPTEGVAFGNRRASDKQHRGDDPGNPDRLRRAHPRGRYPIST
jgi:hypothetical protein